MLPALQTLNATIDAQDESRRKRRKKAAVQWVHDAKTVEDSVKGLVSLIGSLSSCKEEAGIVLDGDNSMKMVTMLCDNSVYLSIDVDVESTDGVSEKKCNVRLDTFASCMQKLGSGHSLRFKVTDDDTVEIVSGKDKATIRCIDSTMEVIDIDEFEWTVELTICAGEFAKCVKSMNTSFTMDIDAGEGTLGFTCNEMQWRIKKVLALGDAAKQAIDAKSIMKGFSATYKKNDNFRILCKLLEMSDSATLSFSVHTKAIMGKCWMGNMSAVMVISSMEDDDAESGVDE